MTEIQREIRRVRRLLELKQEDVGRRAGLARQTVSQLESTDKRTLDNLARVADALGCSIRLVPFDEDARNALRNAVDNGEGNGDVVPR